MFKVFRSVSLALQWVINNEVKTLIPIDALEKILLKKAFYSTPNKSLIIIIDQYKILD